MPAQSPLPKEARVKSKMKSEINVIATQKIIPTSNENKKGFWIL
jgi:hypothetical protein